MSDPRGFDDRADPESLGLEDVPGLARVAASAWWHTAEWWVGGSIRTARRLVEAASSPDAAHEISEAVREAARDLASVGGIGERVRSAVPEGSVAEKVVSAASDATRPRERSTPTLSDLGEELMERSRDVNYDEEAHPAYERILSELAPDEGRILRLLLLDGPQPAVDVRTGGPVGLLHSRLIAAGFTMIGARAGLRYTDRVQSYLNNLFRLGMIWFSRETLQDPLPYQVVEAQPEVLEAMHAVRFPKVVRRSIHLTPFGEDFCRQALALETATMAALPTHLAPEEDIGVGPPHED